MAIDRRVSLTGRSRVFSGRRRVTAASTTTHADSPRQPCGTICSNSWRWLRWMLCRSSCRVAVKEW